MGGRRLREVVAHGLTVSIFYFNIFAFCTFFLLYFSSNLFLEGSKLVNCQRLLRLPLKVIVLYCTV